jgi:Domain of unknown function (DUF4389)
MSGPHPVAVAIDYLGGPLNRLTTALRPFVALPILVVLGTVSGGSIDWTRGDTRTTVVSAGGLPLVKWFLAIPHYIVLAFLWIGVVVAVVIAWFAILFTGRYPRGLFDFVVGVARWHLRVVGYAFALVTNAYPPFRLGP